MRDFAPLGTKWLGYFFVWGGVLEIRRDACTDFDAKYVKRYGSAQGSAFRGSLNQYLRFRPPFSPKWSRDFAHAQKFIRLLTQGRALFWHNFYLPSSQSHQTCIVNRQIGVVDSKYVGKIYPLRTGHVIRRMRTSQKRNVNGIQWKTLWLITQERISIGCSNLVAGLDTWPAMCDNCSRPKGQTSRLQGHVTYHQTQH